MIVSFSKSTPIARPNPSRIGIGVEGGILFLERHQLKLCISACDHAVYEFKGLGRRQTLADPGHLHNSGNEVWLERAEWGSVPSDTVRECCSPCQSFSNCRFENDDVFVEVILPLHLADDLSETTLFHPFDRRSIHLKLVLTRYLIFCSEQRKRMLLLSLI